jgi:hypothetical protein
MPAAEPLPDEPTSPEELEQFGRSGMTLAIQHLLLVGIRLLGRGARLHATLRERG